MGRSGSFQSKFCNSLVVLVLENEFSNLNSHVEVEERYRLWAFWDFEGVQEYILNIVNFFPGLNLYIRITINVMCIIYWNQVLNFVNFRTSALMLRKVFHRWRQKIMFLISFVFSGLITIHSYFINIISITWLIFVSGLSHVI